jgi:hypothetical protein
MNKYAIRIKKFNFKYFLLLNKTLFDPFFVSTYNVFFSSLPVLALGVFDQVN